MAISLLVIGYLISLVGGVMLLVAAFRVSVGWGLASLFIPFASFVFMVKHWDVSRRPFFTSLWSLPFLALGVMMLIAQAPDPALEANATPVRVEASAAVPAALQVGASDPNRRRASTDRQSSARPGWPNIADTYPAEPRAVERREENASAEPEGDSSRAVQVEQVYASRQTRLYYSLDCASRPDDTYRMPKSLVVRQGFQPAECSP